MGEYVHSKQARFDQSFCSCGLMEVHHLPDQTATKTLFAIATALYHKANPRPAAFIMFSDVVNNGNKSRGELLAEEIKNQNKFGPLTETHSVVNPKTGNTIKVWLLTINHETFREFYKEELANRVEE